MTSEDFRNLSVGQQITGKTLNFKEEEILVTGNISAINDDVVYILRKFPKREYFAIKKENINTGVKDAKENK
mgnify:CR=1 FL=1|tara:strand:- start:8351 stop:8566 length:216 start_codon:yes stop_codon:yes gene_type:complete